MYIIVRRHVRGRCHPDLREARAASDGLARARGGIAGNAAPNDANDFGRVSLGLRVGPDSNGGLQLDSPRNVHAFVGLAAEPEQDEKQERTQVREELDRFSHDTEVPSEVILGAVRHGCGTTDFFHLREVAESQTDEVVGARKRDERPQSSQLQAVPPALTLMRSRTNEACARMQLPRNLIFRPLSAPAQLGHS